MGFNYFYSTAMKNNRFDYIICGGGSSGLLLLKELLADPYFENYQFSLNQMNQHVDKGIGTDQIVKIIENILQAQKPKARYKVGAPLQKLSGILKTLLPSRIFEKLLMNHYKL